MTRRAWLRLQDIAENIALIEQLLANRTVEDLERDRVVSAALERFLEIVSEASRHLPSVLTEAYPLIPWRRMADLGNVLRHAYGDADLALLWEISRSHLPALKTAVLDMMQRPDAGG